MAQIIGLNQILEGDIPDANPHRENFQKIKEQYNFHDRNKTLAHGIDSSSEIIGLSYINNLSNILQPVGSVEAIWDSGNATVPSLDSDYWVIMDGTVLNDEESLFNGAVIPDMSEAYIRISSSCSNSLSGDYTYPYSNIEHEHNIPHTHTINSHNHSLSTTHIGHSVGENIAFAKIGVNTNNEDVGYVLTSVSNSDEATNYLTNGSTFNFSSSRVTRGTRLNGVTHYPTDDPIEINIGSSVVGDTSNSVSISSDTMSNIDIDLKPYSVKVRFYLRYK